MKKLFGPSLELFLVFFKIGSFTFGGGLAMLPLIKHEVVDRKKWVQEDEILDVFAISQSVPGVISLNSAIFIGKKVDGLRGAVFAAVGVALPAFISILLVIAILSGLAGNKYVDKVLSGIRAASAGLILLAGIKLGKGSIKNKKSWIIALISFAVIVLLNINAMWVVIFGGAVGVASYFLDKRRAS